MKSTHLKILIIFGLGLSFLNSAHAQQVIKETSVFWTGTFRDPTTTKIVTPGQATSAIEFKEIDGNHAMSSPNAAIYSIPAKDINQGWRIDSVIPYGYWERYYCGACGSRNCEYDPQWETVECRNDIPVFVKPDRTSFYLQESPYPVGNYYQNSEHPHKGECTYKIILKRDAALAVDSPDQMAEDSQEFLTFIAQYSIPKHEAPKPKVELPVEITWMLDTSVSMDKIKKVLIAQFPKVIEQVLTRIPVYQNQVINVDGIVAKGTDVSTLTSTSTLSKKDQTIQLAKIFQNLPKGSDDEKPLKTYIDFLAAKGSIAHTHQYLILFTDEDDSSEYSSKQFIDLLHQTYPHTEFTLIIFVNPIKARKLVGMVPVDGIRISKFNLLSNDIQGFENNLKRMAAQIHVIKEEVLSRNLTLKLPKGYSVHKITSVLVNRKKYKDYVYIPKTGELKISLETTDASSASINFAGDEPH